MTPVNYTPEDNALMWKAKEAIMNLKSEYALTDKHSDEVLCHADAVLRAIRLLNQLDPSWII